MLKIFRIICAIISLFTAAYRINTNVDILVYLTILYLGCYTFRWLKNSVIIESTMPRTLYKLEENSYITIKFNF